MNYCIAKGIQVDKVYDKKGFLIYPQIISNIAKSPEKIQIIIDIIKKVTGKCIILSDRISLLENLKNSIDIQIIRLNDVLIKMNDYEPRDCSFKNTKEILTHLDICSMTYFTFELICNFYVKHLLKPSPFELFNYVILATPRKNICVEHMPSQSTIFDIEDSFNFSFHHKKTYSEYNITCIN